MTAYDDAIGPLGQAFLASQSAREAFEDLSAAEINALPMAEYARLTGRSLHGRPARPATGDTSPATPNVPAAVSEAAPGIDFNDLPYEEQRRIAGIGQHVDTGIFGGVLSGSAEYRDAAARHAGRTGYVQGTNAGAELMARRGRTIVRRDEIPPSGRRSYSY